MVSSTSPLALIMVMVVAVLTATVDAFTFVPSIIVSSSSSLPTTSRGVFSGASSSSDPVEVLSEYMTKSHEEKLRAIKSVEDKKNIEISVLKAEIERLKSSTATASSAPSSAAAVPPPPPSPSSNAENVSNKMGIDEMQSKLESYQSFMADYIVDSQNQKFAAIKEAESRMEKKFMEKIEKLLLSHGESVNGSGSSSSVITSAFSSSTAMVITPAAAPVAAAGGEQTLLFQERNSYIVQAANANKSRWGSMEIERAKEQLLVQPSNPSPLSSSATAGAGAALFDRRNAQVIASAAAGKSRWGDMEVERAMKNGAVVVGVNNSNGSVGSVSSGGGQGTSSGIVVSVEEYVNIGARLLGA